MKITGPGRISPTPKRTSRISRGVKGEAFASHVPDEVPSVARVQTATPVDAVGGILAAQEVPDAAGGRKRGINRGYDLLDRLDELRHGLLLGLLSRERLVELRRQVRERREAMTDERLSAVLDEIELRASVELAKLGLMD